MKLYTGELYPAETDCRFPVILFKSEEELKKYFFGEFAKNETVQEEAEELEENVQDFLQWLWEDWFTITEHEIDN
jgi:hypothetical protein